MDRDEPLRAVLRRHVLGTALVPLLVIEVSLLALYLAFGQEVTGRWREEVTVGLRANLQAVVDARAHQLALTLSRIERQTELIRTQTGLLVRGEAQPTHSYRPELYGRGPGGSLYQLVDDGGASIYYSAATDVGEAEQRKIAATEPLDPLLVRIVSDDPHVVAAYYNTHDDFSRYYPFIPNAEEQFSPQLEMEDYAFYYAADAAHDPQHAVVWTDAYLDPAGHGWMVSSVAPVYDGDQLEGVVGLDVTVPVIAERLLEFDLPHAAPALLLTADGSLLGLSHAAAQRFSEGVAILEQAPSRVDDRERTLDQEAPLARLLSDHAAAEQLRLLLGDDAPLSELTIDGEVFFVVHASIDAPPWRLALLVSKQEVMAPVDAIASRSRTIALLVIGGMAIFYALFFQVIYRRSRRLADRVATPLASLEKAAETEVPLQVTSASGIAEIDGLWLSVREMMQANRRHQARIEALNHDLEAEIREQVRKNREKDHLLVEQSRLVSLGEMVASIAHQWRQPLTSLQFLVDDLRMQADDDSPPDATALREYLDDAQQLIGHMSQTIDDFRTLYRASPEPERVTLRTVVDRALSVADGGLKSAGVAVEVLDDSDGATVEGRPNELCHAVLNLLSNAQLILTQREVTQPRIEIRLSTNDGVCVIEIEDNAGGIEPEIAPRLFQAFATTRPDGTGLGLYMSRRLVVERFGGYLDVHDGKAGACFRIELPEPDAEPLGSIAPVG